MTVRKAVNELVGLHRLEQTEDRDKKLSQHMSQDEVILKLMETMSCKDSIEAVNQILKKLGSPIMTNLYYGTVKQLLERISSVMVDREAVQVVISELTANLQLVNNWLFELKYELLSIRFHYYWALIFRTCGVNLLIPCVKVLVKIVNEAVNNGPVVEELGLDPEVAGERGLRLLFVLSFVFPSHFMYKDIIHKLLQMLGHNNDYRPNKQSSACSST